MSDPYAHIRAAFHEVALAAMALEDPPLVSAREYRRLEQLRQVWKPIDKQGEVEPFNVQADWEERA